MSKCLVAKTYENLPQVGDEYTINGKTYVKVRLKSGDLKQVRSYSEKEYRKYYPETKTQKILKTQRDVFGFGEQGYIWLFKGETYENIDWFRWAPTRYAETLGWYLPSDIDMPDPLPANITPIKLFWDQVKNKNDETKMVEKDELKKITDSLIYDKGDSKWIGEVGDKLILDVICQKVVTFQSAYGTSTIYNFMDIDKNLYSWTTSTTPNIQEGNYYNISGKVKDHEIYRNKNITIIQRVKVNKELEQWEL